ncbi:SelT/SelW/SelH family protein [uncultured Friedmanniella sp.]|uniref:SelT/SelW/SelH family protein n=1 Tax=uncultured Friedmanniella sp. TaxID=335381 RepID=UPI0035CAEAE7
MTELPTVPEPARPRVEITYCTQCRWLLRATWLASELLTSFGTDLGEVALRPGTGGVFRVRVAEEVVWDRKVEGGFPELGPLKRLVRDRVAPGRSLGHTDRAAAAAAPTRTEPPETP